MTKYKIVLHHHEVEVTIFRCSVWPVVVKEWHKIVSEIEDGHIEGYIVLLYNCNNKGWKEKAAHY